MPQAQARNIVIVIEMDIGRAFQISVWHFWLLLAILLMIAEIIVPGFFFVCIAFACATATLASYAGFGIKGQILAFVIGVVAALAGVRPFLLRFFSHPDPDRRTNVHAVIGKSAVVLEEVSPDAPGRIRVGGESWRASASVHEAFKPGDQVTVVGFEGSTLYISSGAPAQDSK